MEVHNHVTSIPVFKILISPLRLNMLEPTQYKVDQTKKFRLIKRTIIKDSKHENDRNNKTTNKSNPQKMKGNQ